MNIQMQAMGSTMVYGVGTVECRGFSFFLGWGGGGGCDGEK